MNKVDASTHIAEDNGTVLVIFTEVVCCLQQVQHDWRTHQTQYLQRTVRLYCICDWIENVCLILFNVPIRWNMRATNLEYWIYTVLHSCCCMALQPSFMCVSNMAVVIVLLFFGLVWGVQPHWHANDVTKLIKKK